MEIHPRTLAATFRDMARDAEAKMRTYRPGIPAYWELSGKSDGLRLAAEHLEQAADAAFDRVMAEGKRVAR